MTVKSQAIAEVDEDLSIEDILKIVYETIDSKKGGDIIILDLTEQVDYLDYLIICSGQTEIHNKAIADAVSAELYRYDIIADGLYGYQHGDWVVLDYGVLVVHVFLPRLRDFYRLEELWAAGRMVELK